MPKAAVEQQPALWFYLEADESERQGNHEAAMKVIGDGLRLYPDNYYLEWQQALNFIELKQYAQARRAYAILLGRHKDSEVLRFTFFNNIAYVNILSGDDRLLPQADECSRRALEKYPWNAYFKGTRGMVLNAKGDYEAGLKLLHQSLKQVPERKGRALNACFIAIAEARRGNMEESHNYYALARRLDPKCFLLERENQEETNLHR